VLNLSRNKIRQVFSDPNSAFAVQELNLSANRLVAVDFLTSLKPSSLRVLKISGNPFADDSETSFMFANFIGQFKHLRDL
jgi:Leucine-rich repeat (LRR) protein